MKKRFVISVMFEDQVGIIADVTETVKNLGGNLEDISQTVLRGYFSMILLATFDNETEGPAIQEALQKSCGRDFAITVKECHGLRATIPVANDENVYVLTACAPDQSGLVAMIAGYLKERNINIRDLTTCITPEGEYTMIMEIVIPSDIDVSLLQRSLGTSMTAQKLNIGLRHYRLFRETNEI